MSDEVTQELLAQILEFFKKKNKMMTSRDVANGLKIENRAAKKALTILVNEGTLEFTSYGGATFIKLPDSEQTIEEV
jgi:Mn-dependent DtxR family transcriptional regulator